MLEMQKSIIQFVSINKKYYILFVLHKIKSKKMHICFYDLNKKMIL